MSEGHNNPENTMSTTLIRNLSDEHMRLATFAIEAHATLDALETLPAGEVLAAREEADRLTPAQIERLVAEELSALEVL